MANGIRTGDPCGFNKGHSLKFREGSRVQQTPEEGWWTYRLKRCGNNNKDEDIVRKPFMIPIIIFFTLSEFFTPVLTDSFSLKSEWQQITSGLQDPSQYSSRCQQYSGLSGLNSSSDH